MNPCGHYKIFSGEVLGDGQIEVGLVDVNDKTRTLTIVLSREFGPIRIGSELEITGYGHTVVQDPVPS